MYCPYCRNELAEPVGRFCGCCHRDIGFMAAATLDGSESEEATEAAFFQRSLLEDQTCEGMENLELGDLIEIFRDLYQHWAVYVGNGYVVHLVSLGEARKEKLRYVVNKDQWGKNNIKHPSYDNTLEPRPKEEIVKEALSCVEKDMMYSFATWNSEHFVTMCRYGKALSVQDPKPGDLIEIDRGLYYHWAVYIGDGEAVHLVTPGSSLGISSSGASSTTSVGYVWGTVKQEKLLNVVGKDTWRVNNLHDRKRKPRLAQEIVEEALLWVDKDVKYSINSWNCEHFATRCRYGKPVSRQARVLRHVGATAAVAAVGTGIVVNAPVAVAAGGLYLVVQGVKKIFT